MGLTLGSNCWCGDLLPATSSKVSDSQCSTSCQGFPDNKCGGSNAWSVSLTGLNNNVGSVQDSSSDSDSGSGSSSNAASSPAPKATTPSPTPSPATTSTTPTPPAKSKSTAAAVAVAQPESTKDKPPSTVTRAATVVVTAPGQTQPAAAASGTHQASKGPNTAGIAAGVVVGVIVVCAFAGGLFFFLRNRKRRAAEEEYQRENANPFGAGAESITGPPASSCSMSDSRLEPSVMMQRRQSDGSIADNQDYSRRILKVTNPDGT
ncbi:MAG: hypothetical protein Q9222_000532 [Ikaeria aurantiellina]